MINHCTMSSFLGESKQSLGFTYRISPNLLTSVIPEVCEAIYEALQPMYLMMPNTEEKWSQVQAQYHFIWQFPNCIGALDGKRVLIAKPPKSGSTYYDYKCHFSTILLALVDANLRFLYVDVGSVGRASDGGVWEKMYIEKSSGFQFDENSPSKFFALFTKNLPKCHCC